MNKITPMAVLGNTLTQGNFQKIEGDRHKRQSSFWGMPMRSINTEKFGEYFEKCTGTLNSIIKRGVMPHTGNQMVVKNKIGYRRSYCGTKDGNATYAKRNIVFTTLCREHVGLICKKHKAQIVSDFCTLKEDYIIRFHSLKVMAEEFISDQIMVSDSKVISYRNPSEDKYYAKDMGFMTLNSRIILKEDVLIAINDDGSRYGKHSACIGVQPHCGETGGIVFRVMIRELKNVQRDPLSLQYDMTTLFEVTCIHSRSAYTTSYQFDHFNTQFDGIDVNGMADKIANEFNKFYGDFDADLESLREKYHGEFLLSEICDSDNCAI